MINPLSHPFNEALRDAPQKANSFASIRNKNSFAPANHNPIRK